MNDSGLQDGFIFDIGGGSAQVSHVSGGRFVRGQSAPIGSLALTDRFIEKDPADKSEVNAVQNEIDRQLDGFEYLEWGRNGTIDDVMVTWSEERICLTLIADIYPTIEIWETEQHAVELLATVFKRAVVLDSTAAPALSESIFVAS